MAWDWATSAGNWLSNGKNLQGLGAAIGGVGSIYGGFTQANSANKMIDLDKQKFQFNKDLILGDEEDERKQKEAYARVYGTGVVAL